MKVWEGYGSEHSMNLVMIGRFKTAGDAKRSLEAINVLRDLASSETETGGILLGGRTARFSESVAEKLRQLKVHSLAPFELEQFAYDVQIDASELQIRFTTDEADVSAFLKVLVDAGARVEIFSAHEYPPTTDAPK